MNELVSVEGADAQVEAELGMTVILTDQGWEAADYVDPENDWTPLEDGSYLAPDGRTRSWPLAGTEPP